MTDDSIFPKHVLDAGEEADQRRQRSAQFAQADPQTDDAVQPYGGRDIGTQMAKQKHLDESIADTHALGKKLGRPENRDWTADEQETLNGYLATQHPKAAGLMRDISKLDGPDKFMERYGNEFKKQQNKKGDGPAMY